MTSANNGAMLYQLTYEATHWEPGHFVGSIFPMKEIDERINENILHGGEKQAIPLKPCIFFFFFFFFQASFPKLHKLVPGSR